MTKIVKSALNQLVLSKMDWFLKSLQLIAEAGCMGIKLQFPKKVKLDASGLALIQLLQRECSLRGISLKTQPAFPIITAFPHHHREYSMDWFENALKPQFIEDFLERNAKDFSDDEAFDLRLLFSELTQNAKDHSGSEQFLVLLEKDAIGVFDLGVGIPAKLAQRYEIESDIRALEKSVQKGVTTRRLRAGGYGLYYTLEFVKRNAGTLTIISGNAKLTRFIKNKVIRRKALKQRFPGTIVYCKFNSRRKK